MVALTADRRRPVRSEIRRRRSSLSWGQDKDGVRDRGVCTAIERMQQLAATFRPNSICCLLFVLFAICAQRDMLRQASQACDPAVGIDAQGKSGD